MVNHFLVINGVQLTEKGKISGFYILDPDIQDAGGENLVPLSSFLKSWAGIFIFITKKQFVVQ
jgi:hypothetical protein